MSSESSVVQYILGLYESWPNVCSVTQTGESGWTEEPGGHLCNAQQGIGQSLDSRSAVNKIYYREVANSGGRNAPPCDVTIDSSFDIREIIRHYCPFGTKVKAVPSGWVCVVKDKEKGCSGGKSVGDPCNAGTGNEYQVEKDFLQGGLSLARVYNSFDAFELNDRGFGYGWSSLNTRRLEINGDHLVIRRPDGKGEPWDKVGDVWIGDADSKFRLAQDATGFTLDYPSGESDRYDLLGKLLSRTNASGQTTNYAYDASNRLVSVTGPFGHQIILTYSADNHIDTVSDMAGNVYRYGYDALGNLVEITFPGGAKRQYHYDNALLPHALTEITDENGDPFASIEYGADGKAVKTEHAQTINGSPQDKTTLAYSGNQTIVTRADGEAEVFVFQENLGIKNLISRKMAADNKGITRQYDNRNNLISETDAEGRTTIWTYNAANQKTAMTEAAGTPQARTTTYEYLSPTLDLVTRESGPGVSAGHQRQTVTVYDPNILKPLSVTISGYRPDGSAVSRTTRYQYNSHGQVTQIDGPRTDVSDITTQTWYDCNTGGKCGQLKSRANALGQTTTYDSYDANANLLQSTDPNGVVTTMSWDARNRLTSVTRTPPAGQGAARTTSYTYDNVGQMTSATLPDGVTLTYTYDAAHYLRSITDNLGNRVEYHYDLKGNRDREDIKDSDGKLVRSIRTAHDLRNRVSQITDAGNTSIIDHDAVGNAVSETDPNNNPATTHQYDALDRLVKTTDALGGETRYEYDPAGHISKIISPINAETGYQYDDLGNLLQETSPDRGTIRYSHDAAGNTTAITDARGITATFSYDALNRVTAIDYPGADEDITYTWDNCPNGIGRLCAIQDQSGTTAYSYDPFGNISLMQKTEAGVTYSRSASFDAVDRITNLTYPDGRRVHYSRDALGRISAIDTTIEGQTSAIDTAIGYRADQQLARHTFGNGITEQRSYGPAGRLLAQKLGNLDTRRYAWDKNSNLLSQTSSSQLAQYQYDAINRLSDIRYWLNQPDPGLPAGSSQTINSQYSPASNRMTHRDGQAVQLDAAGNTTSDHGGQRTFEYNNRGRLWKLYENGQLKAEYVYNANGQRTRKTANGTTTVYHYDHNGHLIEETTASGQPVRDYIWADNRPIAQIETSRDAAGKLHNDNIIYLFSDHLNTPRIGMDQNQHIIWRWDGTGFGEQAANDDPDNDGNATTVNLRFPGQYLDAESGLHYNWNRYYNPETGRYISSDPIGLDGGVNTFGYVGGNPLSRTDIRGTTLAIPWGVGGLGPLGWGLIGGGILYYCITSGACSLPDLLPDDPPDSRSIPKPKAPRCGCTCVCRADANDNIPGNIKPGDKAICFW